MPPVFGHGTTPAPGGLGAKVTLHPDWQQTLNNEMRATWALIGRELEASAKARVPFDTGRLHGSLKGRLIWPPRKGPGPASGAILSSDVHYAAFVEYGTGRRGAASPQPEGLAAGYVHGPSPGMYAQPYFRPAMLDVLRRWFGMRR